MVSLGAIVVAAESRPNVLRSAQADLGKVDSRGSCGKRTDAEETLTFDEPAEVMRRFSEWLKAHRGRPMFISDNNGFDWQFVNWYFHHFLGENPFGHSSQNLGSLFKGLSKDMSANFKHLRKTRHSHHPVDDVRGNAEALLQLKDKFGLKINLS